MIPADSMTYPMPAGYEPQTLRIEAYGPYETAIVVDARPRDALALRAAVRDLLRANGGALGAPDSVAYLFYRVGRLILPHGGDPRSLVARAIAAGAEDALVRGRTVEVLTEPRELRRVLARLARHDYPVDDMRIMQRAGAAVTLADERAAHMHALLEALGSLEGVDAVHSNVELIEAAR